MVEKKLIKHLKLKDTPVKSKKIPQSITDHPLSERDGYLNMYAEEMKDMKYDRKKIFRRNNKKSGDLNNF